MGCLLFICHPSYKLVPGIWLCSVLLPFSQLCLAASHHHFPLSEPSPKTFLFEMFSDLPLPSHPNHSPWNKYRTLQSVPRACQIQAIYAVVLAISHTNRSSPRYLLFFPSMHNIVFTQSWCSVHISLKCNVPELPRELHSTGKYWGHFTGYSAPFSSNSQIKLLSLFVEVIRCHHLFLNVKGHKKVAKC